MESSSKDGSLIVRASAQRDIPAITAIYGHAVRTSQATFELDPPDATEMAKRREALVLAGLPYVVAEIAGEIAGYAYAGRYNTRLGYAYTLENSVYVHEDVRGRGIGRALMLEVLAAAEAGGFRQMVAVIGDSGNLASVRLHEQLGFRLVGTLRSVGWKHERWLDTVLMQRPLGLGDTVPADTDSG